MRVLVTGGAGFIGSHIVDALLLRGHTVVVLDDLSSGRRENRAEGASLYQLDVTDAGWIRQLGAVDAICHQAAQPSLRRSLDDPAYDAMVNIIGTLNVIQAAKAWKAHVVFASTSAVYASDYDRPFRESGPFKPETPYGVAKYAAEHYLDIADVSHAILRYGNVYGPRQVQVGENQLVPHVLAHLLNGAPFVINGDGEQARDFVYVEDVARANVQALEGRVRGTFNCGAGQGVSVNAVCAALARLVGKPTEFVHGPAKAGEARHVALDSTRARDVLGWQAEISLDDGLKRTVAWRSER